MHVKKGGRYALRHVSRVPHLLDVPILRHVHIERRRHSDFRVREVLYEVAQPDRGESNESEVDGVDEEQAVDEPNPAVGRSGISR